MSWLAPRLAYRSFNERLGRPFGNRLRALGGQSPDILQHDQHLDPEDKGERLCKAFPGFARHCALQGRCHALQKIDAVAAREQRLVAEGAGLALRPLVQRKLQCRLEGGLELVDARHRGRQQVGNAGACIGAIGRPVEYRPQSFVHHGMHERGLAGKVTVGRCARHFGGLGDFAYRRSDAGLHEPRCRFEHQFSRAGTRASLGGSGGFVLLT